MTYKKKEINASKKSTEERKNVSIRCPTKNNRKRYELLDQNFANPDHFSLPSVRSARRSEE